MRPILSKETNPEEFIDFYWLKEELLSFCKGNDLPTGGNKGEVTQRIYTYLKTGKVIVPTNKKSTNVHKNNVSLDLDTKFWKVEMMKNIVLFLKKK